MRRPTLTRVLISGLLYLSISFSSHTNAAGQGTDAIKYAPQGWLAKSLPEISAALQAGAVTSEALVEAYLLRIKAETPTSLLDQFDGGAFWVSWLFFWLFAECENSLEQ